MKQDEEECDYRVQLNNLLSIVSRQKLAMVGGRYVIDYARMPGVIAQLCKRLLEMEDAGDRAGAEAWFAKYDKIPGELQKALAGTAGIPVDIDPVFSFADNVR